MLDAWIYTASRGEGSDLAAGLAELGFSPRTFPRSGGPAPEDGRSARAPALILIAAGPGEPPPDDVCAELRRREELADVPLLLAVEPEHLDASAELVAAHEVLVKPFALAELRARVARARRFATTADGDEVVRVSSLELNLVTYSVHVDGVPISFAYMEYELLKFLMTHPGRVFSREALLKRVWGYDYFGGARTVDVHVRRLRAKLGQEHAARIKTVRSVGYLFDAGAALAAHPAGRLRTQDAEPARSARPIRIGFIALSDAAPVVVAYENGFFDRRGLEVRLVRQASWPATRDALLRGDIDAAHGLFALPLAVAAGIGGVAATTAIRIAMVLNQNGQGITLKHEWAEAGYDDLTQARRVMRGGEGQTYAMTFPGGTHDTWLRYWLKACGIDPGVPQIIPIPPPQMVENIRVGTMDAYCVGEPWNGLAAAQGLGFTELATQDLWDRHPEKALLVSAGFAASREADLRSLMGAVLEAARWLDEPANRSSAADVLSRPEYVNARPEVIRERLVGHYDLGGGLGTKVFGEGAVRFCGNGDVNLPRRGHAIWFLAQYVRFGYLAAEPRYEEIANELILQDLYREVAELEGLAAPADDMQPFAIRLDGVEFDPRRPSREAHRR